jgi:hypothetical protein
LLDNLPTVLLFVTLLIFRAFQVGVYLVEG